MGKKNSDLIYCTWFYLSRLSCLRVWQHRLTDGRLKALCVSPLVQCCGELYSWSCFVLCFWACRHTRSEAAIVWRGEEHNWFTILRACVYWAPRFHFCDCRPLTVRHDEQWALIQAEHCRINSTQENECGVIERGPSTHTASLSYNLSYFPSRRGW